MSTEGLMQDNCQFGDMLKDEKRKSQFKYELGRLMGEYAVPLPLGNFNMSNKVLMTKVERRNRSKLIYER